jgi:DNA-binding response OmpR family regulator
VVDDDAPIRKLMETHLKGMGYRSATAKDGKEGLERAHREPPAAVVLDLMMPRMDGFEFLERFRATREGQGVPIIVWTNKDLSMEERARLEGRAQMVLSKGEGGSLELVNRLQAMLARGDP